MNVPVVIVFFNRLEPLKRLVERLAKVRPSRVYLVADGARRGRAGEADKVEACRAFMRKLPWQCEVKENFASENLGCRKRVTSGLDWVFEQEDRAIILEDDCIPEPEFFPWVEEMLERYKVETKVFSVSGTNLRPELCMPTEDCTFSKYAMFWGWATWRRAWQKNDKDLSQFPNACQTHLLKRWLGRRRAEWYWRYLLTHVRSSWGYRWSFTHFVNEAYCVLPTVNLVDNIGMTDEQATHTLSNPYLLAKVEKEWCQPKCGPSQVEGNMKLDKWIDDHFYSRSLLERVRWIIRRARG